MHTESTESKSTELKLTNACLTSKTNRTKRAGSYGCLRGEALPTHSSKINLNFSKSLILHFHEFHSIFDFFLQNLLQLESLHRNNSVSTSIIWFGVDFISQFPTEFPSIRWILIKTESSWILRISDTKLYYFSSDLSCVNIAQMEIHQNTEMERNTWTLCFREWNVKGPLFLRTTLEN